MDRKGPPSRQKAIAVEIRAAPPPTADILVDRQTVHVTFSLPGLAPDQANVLVKKNYVRLQSKSDPARTDYLLTLPMPVVPGEFVVRETHGVWDFTLTRAADA